MFAVGFAHAIPLGRFEETASAVALSGECVYQNSRCQQLLGPAQIEQANLLLLPQLFDHLAAKPFSSTGTIGLGFESQLTLNELEFTVKVTPLVEAGAIIGYWSSVAFCQLGAEEQDSLRRLDAFINTENDPLVCLQFSHPLPRMVDGETLARAYLDARITRISAPAAQLAGRATSSLLNSRLRELENSQIEALLQNSFPVSERATQLDLAATAELLVELPSPLSGVYRLKPTFVPGAGGYAEVWLRITDITADELQAHQQLELNQTRELALRAASLYQFEIDLTNSSVLTDETGLRAMGINDIPQDVTSWIDLIQNERGRPLDAPFHDAFQQNSEPLNSVFKVRNAKGEDRHIEIWAMAPEGNSDEKATRYFGLYRDVTRSRKLQSRLRDKKTLESLGVLAGGIAHDFNNMLMSILGYAELLELDLQGASNASAFHSQPSAFRTQNGATHSIEEIKRAAKRASDLCTSLLAYAGQHPVEKRNLSLAQLVRNTTELMQVTTGKQVPINLEIHAEPTICADSGQLTQVIMNLVGNAADAMHGYDGQIDLEVGQQLLPAEDAPLTAGRRTTPDQEVAYIRVTDSGCGMNPQVLQRMYEPFFTTKSEGRGLGMAAAHGIIANHNGAIHVTSAPNKGTQFRLYFPLHEANKAREIAPPIIDDPHEPSRPQVLVVDDEDNVREIVCEMLAHLNCHTAQATQAQQALALAADIAFDYALVDITMPGMSGVELAGILLDRYPTLTVILSSGYTQHELPHGLLELCPFIHKPYTLSEVATVLNLPYAPTQSVAAASD